MSSTVQTPNYGALPNYTHEKTKSYLMLQATIFILFNLGYFCLTRSNIRPPHKWAVIPTHKLRVLRKMVSIQIVMWSILSIRCLAGLAYIDFGSMDLNLASQLSVLMPLIGAILSVIQVRQLFQLRALYAVRIAEGPIPIETSPRFKELLEAYETNPSRSLLEALLREIGPPPRSRRFFRRHRSNKWFDS